MTTEMQRTYIREYMKKYRIKHPDYAEENRTSTLARYHKKKEVLDASQTS